MCVCVCVCVCVVDHPLRCAAGLKQIRLLDIKVGFLTSDANWKGKSRFAAARNQMVDQLLALNPSRTPHPKP